MKWRRHRDDESATHDNEGIEQARAALDEAMNLWPEVNSVVQEIRGIRRRNHLAELTDRALTKSPRRPQ